jgi:hypothetical protein
MASGGATAQISEAWLLPVLPDSGSEFINHTVAKLLNKLLVEQTKWRPRHSNDNGLDETKNGWVIRKHIGYGHIARRTRKRSTSFTAGISIRT